MGASKSNDKNFELYKLKIVKETDVPIFVKKEKKGDSWVETDEYDMMEGRLKKIEAGSYVYEGKEKKTFAMFMDDGNASIKVDCSLNNMTRKMLNYLSGAASIGNVKLTARKWGKKDSDKKYPTVFVEVNGQKSDVGFPYDQLPKVEEIKNKKGEVLSKDDSELNDFFIANVIPEINSKIQAPELIKSEMDGGSNGAIPPNKESGKGKVEVTREAIPDIQDDLPF